MQSKIARPSLAFVLACLLGVLLFAFDASMADLHLWARYLLPVALVFFWGRRPAHSQAKAHSTRSGRAGRESWKHKCRPAQPS